MLKLEPGQFVSELGLARQLAIGRTPVREALQQLAREGLVKIIPRRGVIVTQIDIRGHIDLLAIRRGIERAMVRFAPRRATKIENARFSVIASDMLQAAEVDDDAAFMRLDAEYNRFLATAGRNDYAKRSMSMMQGVSRRFWYWHYREVRDLPVRGGEKTGQWSGGAVLLRGGVETSHWLG
jgi:DNA-binding GntR family transcriptional regulator